MHYGALLDKVEARISCFHSFGVVKPNEIVPDGVDKLYSVRAYLAKRILRYREKEFMGRAERILQIPPRHVPRKLQDTVPPTTVRRREVSRRGGSNAPHVYHAAPPVEEAKLVFSGEAKATAAPKVANTFQPLRQPVTLPENDHSVRADAIVRAMLAEKPQHWAVQTPPGMTEHDFHAAFYRRNEYRCLVIRICPGTFSISIRK